MKKEKVDKLELGLYIIYWKSGGASLAAVGCLSDGTHWIAPSNWITVPMDKEVILSVWKKIRSVEILHSWNYIKFMGEED